MLVLSRRQGESICVGDGVTITVLSSQNGRIRLGIEAPAHVRVDRREVRERLEQADEQDLMEELFAAHPR